MNRYNSVEPLFAKKYQLYSSPLTSPMGHCWNTCGGSSRFVAKHTPLSVKTETLVEL